MEIISGKLIKPKRVVVYGPEGVGKSTFASKFPKPLYIDTEGSTVNLSVDRTPMPSSWGHLFQIISEIRRDPMGYKTVVLDTADWTQRLAILEMCAKKSIDGIEGMGYGKGYTYLAEEFGKLLDAFSGLVDRGLNVVITAHAATRKFDLPEEEGAYDRWEMKLEKKVAPLVKEWADMVLFLTYKTYVMVDDKTKKAKASGGTVRVIKTEHTAAWDAKNRDGLPPELPADFDKIAHCFPDFEIKSTPEPLPVAASTQKTNTQELNGAHKKLVDMMKASGILYGQLLDVIVAKGHYPKGTPFENLDPKFIEGFCIPHWEKILQVIKKQTIGAN